MNVFETIMVLADERWVEIWNDVFMQYNKTKDGKYEPLAQQNVDTGLGVERVTMVLQGKETVFDTELFVPIFKKISEVTGTVPNHGNMQSYRIIADHTRAATFILGDERGVLPSNTDQGYILRRYIRRIIRHLMLLNKEKDSKGMISEITDVIVNQYKEDYPLLGEKSHLIKDEITKEENWISS